MTKRLTIGFGALALAVTLVSIAAARPSATASQTVRVKAKDYSFVLSTTRIRHGMVTFRIRNVGITSHDFVIAGHSSKIIGPGKATTLRVKLKRGRWHYRCSVDSHAQLGMKGVLRVT